MTALTYAMITLGNATLTGVMSGWLLYFYLPPAGEPLVPLALYGVVVFISRAIHVPLTLLINNLSQHTRGKLSYLTGGALFMPLLFALLWTPPHSNESTFNLLYLFIVLVAFNLASGIHQAAYETLPSGLAVDEKGRAAISSWRMLFLLGGNVLAGFAGPLIENLGYTNAIWIFAAVSAPFLILPGLFLSRQPSEPRPVPEQTSFLDGLKVAWGKPAFRIFALSWGLMWLATTFTFETLPYIVTEICKSGKADTAYLYFAALVTSLIAYPVVTKLTQRYGVKAVFRGSLLAGAIVAPGLMLISERIPIPLLAQGILWMVLQAASLVGAQALPGAITGEIGAGDQSAFGNLIDQLASGMALAIIPLFLLLGRSQFDLHGPLGVRLLGPAGSLFLLTAFLVFGWYKVEKKNNQLS
jgi:GPH family glycoside/pentoside/hexuronide:cation symporter